MQRGKRGSNVSDRDVIVGDEGPGLAVSAAQSEKRGSKRTHTSCNKRCRPHRDMESYLVYDLTSTSSSSALKSKQFIKPRYKTHHTARTDHHSSSCSSSFSFFVMPCLTSRAWMSSGLKIFW